MCLLSLSALQHILPEQDAHGPIYTILKTAGVYVDDEGKEHHAFLGNDLLGIDVPLARVMAHFRAAAVGSDAERRVLLFYVHPPPARYLSRLQEM